ncbi:MAG: flavodoxin family protein [Candidatus Thorarchaeota archaeon]
MKGRNRRIIGIVGSPRRNGNTEILVDEVLAGASEKGASIRKVILSKLNISPCRACDICTKTGQCVQQDDMTELFVQIEKSDVLVLGTPVYWWGPTAQFKAFLDRWYAVYTKGMFKEKETVLVIPLESKKESNYKPLLDMFKAIMEELQMIHIETILAPGVFQRGAVQENQELLDSSREVGSKLVSMKE